MIYIHILLNCSNLKQWAYENITILFIVYVMYKYKSLHNKNTPSQGLFLLWIKQVSFFFLEFEIAVSYAWK